LEKHLNQTSAVWMSALGGGNKKPAVLLGTGLHFGIARSVSAVIAPNSRQGGMDRAAHLQEWQLNQSQIKNQKSRKSPPGEP
jgi:hypothetical protein